MTTIVPTEAAFQARDAAGGAVRIRRVDAIPVSLPLKKPMRMGGGQEITHSETLIVRMETDRGLVGWGEASAAPLMTGETLAGMRFAVDAFFAPCFVGQEIAARGRLLARAAKAMVGNRGAFAACEIALHDLIGLHHGVPVSELLGGRVRTSAIAMHLLGNARASDDVDEAQRRHGEGCRLFKLKVGVKPVDEEIELARTLRGRLGPDVLLCADANMGLDFPTARRYVTGVAETQLLFLEQPFTEHALDATIALARIGAVALCADESAESVETLVAWQRAGAIGGVNLKTIKAGGLRELMRTATVCDALGLAIDLAAKVGESSIGAAALAHAGLAAPNVDWGISPTAQYLADDLVAKPLVPHGAGFGDDARLDRPGLGIEVDEDAVQRYRVDR